MKFYLVLLLMVIMATSVFSQEEYGTGLIVPDDWDKYGTFETEPSMKSLSVLPDKFDWRDYDGVTPVKNQRQCGSCWAFTMNAVAESVIKIKDGIEVDLSEQYLINCSMNGTCDGGWYDFSIYTQEYDPNGYYNRTKCDLDQTGAVLEQDVPYSGTNRECDACPYTKYFKFDGWRYVFPREGSKTPHIEDIKRAIMEHGPVASGIYASVDLMRHGKGVFVTNDNVYPDHTVAIIGWDDTAEIPHWIVKNSWGIHWSEGGYGRIAYGVNKIGHAPAYLLYEGSGPLIPTPIPTPAPTPVPTPTPVPSLNEVLGNVGTGWQTGMYEWRPETSYRGWVLSTHQILTGGYSSEVKNTIDGPGYLTFDWKLEEIDFGSGFSSRLNFMVDNETQFSIFGGNDTEWKTETFYISEPRTNAVWRIEKENRSLSGFDYAKGQLDNVSWKQLENDDIGGDKNILTHRQSVAIVILVVMLMGFAILFREK